MASKKLTKKDIDAFIYAGGWDVRWDTSLPGFGVRVYPTGKKAYVLSYRNASGDKRLLTLGQTSKITLDKAKEVALKELAQIVDKKDPVQEKRLKRQGPTVADIFEDYLERYLKPKNRSWKESERMFRHDILPAFGRKAIQDVTSQDIVALLDKVVDRGSGTMSNRILANIKRFFNWSIERGLLQHSPADKIRKQAPEESRDRVLSGKEVKAIWQACENEGYPFGTLVQFLLVTAQRKGEVASMRWQDIDLETNLWTIPREITKTDKRHRIPLSPLALSLLERAKLCCPEKSVYVFTTIGDTPFSGFSKAKTRLDKTVENVVRDEWRLHDLRRTAASGMAQAQVLPHVIDKVLNHTSGVISGVAAVYNRHDYVQEISEALRKWAVCIQKGIQ